MDILFLVQFGCCLFTIFTAALLALGRLYLQSVNHRYEVSRWLLCVALVILMVHYVLQMKFGFRAQSDHVGAVVNILFYAPVAYLVSYAQMNMACGGRWCWRYVIISVSSYALILATFFVGWSVYHNLDMPYALYVMDGLFFLSMLFSVINPIKTVHHMHQQVESNTATDLAVYEFFTHSGYALLCVVSIFLPFAIFSHTSLFVIGTIFLLIFFVYVVSFVSLNFTLSNVISIISEDEDVAEVLPEEGSVESEVSAPATDEDFTLIEESLCKWREARGYRMPDINIVTLSRHLGVSRADLSHYIVQRHNVTFRVWLSKLRLEEAKRLLAEQPHYSNDVIAEECGFTSRNYFQNMFKAETGLTPREWVRNLNKQ